MAKQSDPLANLSKDLGKDIPGGLPGSISPEPGQTVPSMQQVNDLHDHLVRLQKQVNEQGKLIEELQGIILHLQECIPDTPIHAGTAPDTFESKVWETVLVGALGASLGPNKVIQDTPKAMQQIVSKAIRLAQAGVDAAKDYKREQEMNKKALETVKNNDPLKDLISVP